MCSTMSLGPKTKQTKQTKLMSISNYLKVKKVVQIDLCLFKGISIYFKE